MTHRSCAAKAFTWGIVRLLTIVWAVTGATASCHAQATKGVVGRSPAASALSPRERININGGWRFLPGDAPGAEASRFDDAKWGTVKLPHTWNAEDTLDDIPGYRMGVGWYRKSLALAESQRGKRLFLYFEGAHQVADLFVNGQRAGQHKGGYTAFAFEITDLVRWDSSGNRNLVAVRVDNSINRDIPPSQAADFNLYGGIYRDVWLIATAPVHLNVLDYASPGVYVETPEVSTASATVRIRGAVTNDANQPQRVRILNTVLDAGGRSLAATESILTVAAGASAQFEQTGDPIRAPQLWSPDTPYLYTVRTEVYDDKGLSDQIENPLGFRWFSFDANAGFLLNGRPFKLRGTNRHQDYRGLGNAVPDELQVKDLELIKQTGLNCVLLAHYPHDSAVLDAADRLGLIVWEEIPIVREISTTEEFARNCEVMLREMIRQHYNHPSIVMWCYMNEIFLRTRSERGYVQKTVELARSLERLARREDPARYTVISANRPYDGSDIYNASGLLDIPKVVGWHMYFGWYYGEFQDLGRFLDEQHRRYPARVIFVSEYGADYDPRLHSLTPRFRDSTTEWAQAYHESYLPQFEERPYLGGSAIWAQFDFGSEARGDSMPHFNTKGIFTFDRRPKDIVYYYRAHYTGDPVLRIATRDWSRRVWTSSAPSRESAGPPVNQPVKIYSNLPEAELLLNGQSLGVKQVGVNRLAVWHVSFRDGLNALEARGTKGLQSYTDRTEVMFSSRPRGLTDTSRRLEDVAINVGSPLQFVDGEGAVWEMDQPYLAGGWGYVGGVPTGTAQNILGTADDPLYQSARQNPAAYRFDVPDGNYQIELRFAEPSPRRKPETRVFGVAVNGKMLIENLDLARSVGALHAFEKRFQVRVEAGQGIKIEFRPVVGETIVNAIRVRRL